jgi:hypothetical protein
MGLHGGRPGFIVRIGTAGLLEGNLADTLSFIGAAIGESGTPAQIDYNRKKRY